MPADTERAAAMHRHIEGERKRLRQAHAVLACLSESLTHADPAQVEQHSDVVDVASDLVAVAIERLDLVVLRAVREANPPYLLRAFPAHRPWLPVALRAEASNVR
jgi:hypothetical protein